MIVAVEGAEITEKKSFSHKAAKAPRKKMLLCYKIIISNYNKIGN